MLLAYSLVSRVSTLYGFYQFHTLLFGFFKKGVDYISHKLSEWEIPGLSSEVGIWWGVAQLQGRGDAVNSEGPGSFPSFSSSIVSTKAAKVKHLHLL